MEDEKDIRDESCGTQCHVDDAKYSPILTPEELEKCSKLLAESKFLAEEAKKKYFSKSGRSITYVGPTKGLSDPSGINITTTTTTSGGVCSNTWVSPNGSGGWSSGSGSSTGWDPAIGGLGSGGSSGGSAPLGPFPPLTAPHTTPNEGDFYRGVPYKEQDWTDHVISPHKIAEEIKRLKTLGYLKDQDLQPSKIFDELKSKFKSLDEFLSKSTREERELFLDLVILKFREISLLENSQIQIISSDKLRGRLALQITIDMTSEEFFKEKENAEPLLPEEDKSVIEIKKDEISFK